MFPAELGQPDYHDDRYDRLFSVIAETGLPVCNHIGLNTALNGLADRDPTPRLAWTMTCMPLSACEALGMWILTGPLVKHPDLKVVFVEPGLGWVAYYLHFLDDMVLRQGYEFPILQGELPSFYYHRNMAMTFIDEPDPIPHLLHRLGTENVMWSSDYPHPVSSWPKSRGHRRRAVRGPSRRDARRHRLPQRRTDLEPLRRVQIASMIPLKVALGRMAAVTLVVVGGVVAADVDRAALHGVELVDDRRLVRGERLGDRGELGRERGVVGLRRQLLGPVHGQVEVAAPVVELVDLARRRAALVEHRAGGRGRGCRRGSARSRCRSVCARCSSDAASARNSPSESQRRWFSFTNCCTCLGAEPPAPVSNRPPPFISGTIESILALVPSSMIGNRSVR